MIDRYIIEHGRRLYGLCIRLCSNTFDADDLYQETWIRAVKNIDKFDPTRDFEPWITKICVNTYRSFLRRSIRNHILNIGDSDKNEELLNSVPAPPAEDYSALHEAIERLPEKLRLTVILFYFRDMDIESTAATMEIPVGTVKSRLNKARKMLKEVLEHETDL